eukprot:Sspe_Gene.812::Locus_273_Transcript_1_1_Confidence_1.000_Length_1054::g.812::m.812
MPSARPRTPQTVGRTPQSPYKSTPSANGTRYITVPPANTTPWVGGRQGPRLTPAELAVKTIQPVFENDVGPMVLNMTWGPPTQAPKPLPPQNPGPREPSTCSTAYHQPTPHDPTARPTSPISSVGTVVTAPRPSSSVGNQTAQTYILQLFTSRGLDSAANKKYWEPYLSDPNFIDSLRLVAGGMYLVQYKAHTCKERWFSVGSYPLKSGGAAPWLVWMPTQKSVAVQDRVPLTELVRVSIGGDNEIFRQHAKVPGSLLHGPEVKAGKRAELSVAGCFTLHFFSRVLHLCAVTVEVFNACTTVFKAVESLNRICNAGSRGVVHGSI